MEIELSFIKPFEVTDEKFISQLKKKISKPFKVLGIEVGKNALLEIATIQSIDNTEIKFRFNTSYDDIVINRQ